MHVEDGEDRRAVEAGGDDLAGGQARAVAAVRTWLKSGRWAEAMALRPPRRHSYHRAAA